MSQKYEYFGKYILLEKLATGGMAEVWLARAPGAGGIGKFVAIKKILPQFSDNPEFLQMFKDEAAIAMNLSHSNIVSIYEFGQVKNQLFLVMDYVEGRNLRQILNKLKSSQHNFSTDQIIYMIKEVAAGLDHAHRSLNSATGKPLNITHRDMSPQNIMITFEGEVRIVDFGIAKAESQIENTKTGTLKGKFGYMSPEQAEGHPTDLRTDIFSLGICLWELLANERLFIANNEINTLKKIRECNIPSLTKVNPNISVELERITMKALTRDRNLRYQTAAAMHRDLNRFLNRQFPDFTPHDFSVFIKTLYTDEILDIRKRLIEYAKIPFKTNSKVDDLDKTLVTSFPQVSEVKTRSKIAGPESPHNTTDDKFNISITKTESFSSSPDSPFDPNQEDTKTPVSNLNDSVSLSISKSAVPKQPILDDLKLKQNYEKKIIVQPKVPLGVGDQPTEDQRALSDYFSKKFGSRRPSESKSKRGRSKSSNNSSINLMIFVAFSIITAVVGTSFIEGDPLIRVKEFLTGIFNSPPIPKLTDRDLDPDPGLPVIAKEEYPSVGEPKDILVPLVINSVPSGAEIFINGVDTKKNTPGRVEVPANSTFSITLKYPRFIDYVKTGLTTELTGHTFTATLQKALVAYIDIDVKPPVSAVIFVNGQQIKDDILPITKYAVPAGVPVTVRAENPITGAFAEQVVTLGEDKRYKVVLKLERSGDKSKRSPSGRR